METMHQNTTNTIGDSEKTTSVLIHLAALLKYTFPFAGIIAQLLIWTSNKKTQFINENGKQALNFQLSLLLYKVIILIVSVPLAIILFKEFSLLSQTTEAENILYMISTSLPAIILGFFLLIYLILPVAELIILIIASVHASNSKVYQYPFSISFIK